MEGKVKSLTKFGAFILLPDGSTGMVHISEVAHAYVSDIHDHLTEGQTVKVMIIGMENGKINLSIKRTVAPPPRAQANRPRNGGYPSGASGRTGSYGSDRPHQDFRPAQPAEPQQKSFDDMLKQYNDRKTKSRRR